MSLLDWFRRKPEPPPDALVQLREVWGELGHHGADLETLKGRLEALRAEWDNQRDILRKLVQRLEKRDQRAAIQDEPEPAPPQLDPEVEGQRKVAQMRRGNGILPGWKG